MGSPRSSPFFFGEESLIPIDEVSYLRPCNAFAYVVNTRLFFDAIELPRNAKGVLCESAYLDEDRVITDEYRHTARQATEIVRDAGIGTLILTHFSARFS